MGAISLRVHLAIALQKRHKHKFVNRDLASFIIIVISFTPGVAGGLLARSPNGLRIERKQSFVHPYDD